MEKYTYHRLQEKWDGPIDRVMATTANCLREVTPEGKPNATAKTGTSDLSQICSLMQDAQVGGMLIELLNPKISEPNYQCHNIII